MVGTSSKTHNPIKFLCSYGGRIVPRYPDGKLRYHGGETRVVCVERSISFSDLLAKLTDTCGSPTTSFRCQLPTEDLDALISITSDEDLSNLIHEYERNPSSSLKIRTFLSSAKNKVSRSPPSSASSSSSTDGGSPKSPFHSAASGGMPPRYPISGGGGRHSQRQMTARPPQYQGQGPGKVVGKDLVPQYYCCYSSGNGGVVYYVVQHSSNYWQ